MPPTVTVCLPALNEAPTIGSICSSIRNELMDKGKVDQLLVVDSGSTDGTRDIAEQAGAEVHLARAIHPELNDPLASGKGEALWKSLAAATGDVIVWLDSDTSDFGPHFVTRLVDTLLADESLVMAKGYYARPESDPGAGAGGRVTEILARPLLSSFWPHLSGIVQPLAGEYAGRREALLRVPFFTGYAVELGLLVDVSSRFGPDSIGQADLGNRTDRAHPLSHLGRMASEILHAAMMRLESEGRMKFSGELSQTLVQFDELGAAETSDIQIVERPPIGPLLV